MDKYKKTFFILTLAYSVPACFSLIAMLVEFEFTGFSIVGGLLVLWWGMYFYLKTGDRLAFWLSFVLVNVYWWPMLFRLIRTIISICTRSDVSWGYFLHFTVAWEQLHFVLFTFALIFGILAIKSSMKTNQGY